MGTKIIWSSFNSDKVTFRWWEIEMNYILNSDKRWIPCTCKANTPNTNLHSNIQHTEWQTEPGPAAPPTILENPDAAVTTLIEMPMAGPRTAATIMTSITPVPVAVELTPITMANNGIHPGTIIRVQRARNARRYVIAIMMVINHDPTSKNLNNI